MRSRALQTVLLLLVGACSSSENGGQNGSNTGGSAGASAAGTSVGGAAAGQAQGGASAGIAGQNAGGSAAAPVAGPGCGFELAAFCDTFDAPAAEQGRAGELDVKRWSAGRMEPQAPTGEGRSLGIGKATLPSCRSDLPLQVFPDQDAVICDPSAEIDSNHLLVATAAQNYGQNSYRIRQPFDFAGRSGKIAFDAEAYIENPLLGWVSVAVTEEPMAVPSFAVGGMGTYNDEGAIVPRSGFTVQFQNHCAGFALPPVFSMRMLNVYQDYAYTTLAPPTPTCPSAGKGKLNHFEISVSQSRIEIYATPVSDDGQTFPAAQLLYAADVALPFSRGYVTISVHNHATLKYSEGNSMDAWVARFDDVGFDGPLLSGYREYEVPDSLVPVANADEIDVGYRVHPLDSGQVTTLAIEDVDLAGASKAVLAFSSWYPSEPFSPGPFENYVLKYRFNGGAWRDRPLSAGELATLRGGNCQGALGQQIEVELGDLVSGDNTLEFVSENIGTNYPPLVANIDLVLSPE